MIGRIVLAAVCMATAPTFGGQALAQKSTVTAVAPAWLCVQFRGGLGGVYIEEVIRDSPADLSGIRSGDVVVAVAGAPTPTAQRLLFAVASQKAGDLVAIQVRRGKFLLEISAQLTETISQGEILRRRIMDLEAPTFTLPAVHGKAHGNLEFYRGKVVVLAFLSGFGTTSRASVEPLANLQAELRGEAVVLGITSDSDAQLKRFVDSNSLPISMLRDTHRQVHERYRSEIVVPSLVVIGRDGVVRYADAGAALNMDAVVFATQRAVRESKR